MDSFYHLLVHLQNTCVVNKLIQFSIIKFPFICYPFDKSNSKPPLSKHSPFFLLDNDEDEGPDAIVSLKSSEMFQRSEMARLKHSSLHLTPLFFCKSQ